MSDETYILKRKQSGFWGQRVLPAGIGLFLYTAVFASVDAADA